MTAAAPANHTYLKRGVYYFNRRVPLAVSRHYKLRCINFSLVTRSVPAARESITAIAAHVERHWQRLLSYLTIPDGLIYSIGNL
jgi:hypothetical protein